MIDNREQACPHACSFPTALLERLAHIPRDTVSLEEFEQRRHLDLPTLSGEELFLEAHRVLLRMILDDDPAAVAWLRERRERVVAETERRGGERAGGRDVRLLTTSPSRHLASPPSLTLFQNGREQHVG